MFFSCSCFFFFKQKTAYEIVSGDWSSDVCSSDLGTRVFQGSRRSITAMHANPTRPVVTVIATCMPTLNDSTAERDATPSNMYTSSACCGPTPPGVNGINVATLLADSASTLSQALAGMWNACRKKYSEAARQIQPVAWKLTTSRRY